jgi:hypothetical protein
MIQLGTFIAPHAFPEMETHRTRALRQARLYGGLINRTGRLYHPGGNRPVCSVQTAEKMVSAGLLVQGDGRYEITREGLRMLAEHGRAPTSR